ncbi:MAG: endonuclease domain-containing protein, partial [Geodermatophilaceae bacterium]
MSSGRLPPLGLRHQVFRGSDAVRAGLITPDQLRGSAYVRLFRNIYADASLEIDHRVRIDGAGLLLPSSAAIARRSA